MHAKPILLRMNRVLMQAQQKLGQIDLPEFIAPREEDEINAYEWAETAARNFDDSRQHVENLETQLATQTETILKLQSQLDSIVQAKVEQEGILLHKFTELINSKKVKIRDQQRLLGTAKVDPDACEYYIPRYTPAAFNFNTRASFPYPIRLCTLSPHILTGSSGAYSTTHISVSQSHGITFF